MNQKEAAEGLRMVIRRSHLSLSTEDSYCHWLRRYCLFAQNLPPKFASEQKLEAFLTALARDDVSASTQNQAFNALLFFYRHVLKIELKGINALRARRPSTIRNAPAVDEVRSLLSRIKDAGGYPTGLVVKLIYGCGLRISEPLNLRIRDVQIVQSRLIIRQSKGKKDRIVALPCSLSAALTAQMDFARVIWQRDVVSQLPIKLPNQIARKYPQAAFAWSWAWLFPLANPCRDPRSNQMVRWRMLECTIQQAMGHKSLETTMGYLHAEALSVRSPLENMPA